MMTIPSLTRARMRQESECESAVRLFDVPQQVVNKRCVRGTRVSRLMAHTCLGEDRPSLVSRSITIMVTTILRERGGAEEWVSAHGGAVNYLRACKEFDGIVRDDGHWKRSSILITARGRI